MEKAVDFTDSYARVAIIKQAAIFAPPETTTVSITTT